MKRKYSYIGPFVATCPVHGDQGFVRCHPCLWWHCPERECRSVIPEERVTPDGADVIAWQYADAPHRCPVLP